MFFALIPSAVWGHEVWLDPTPYQVEDGASLAADLRNGENFNGTVLSYNPYSFDRFERIHDGAALPVEGRLGDRPAFALQQAEGGLHVVAYQAKPSALFYKEWAKFLRFAKHKDFKGIEERHAARGLPQTNFTESYTRFAKTLIAVGDGAGEDIATGMETEIIALANPYTSGANSIPVRVLYQGAPRKDAQIELFERAPDKTVSITLHRTNTQGEAALPIKPGHTYLVDAVLLREPAEGAAKGAVWETLWASLTFAVPVGD